jgi:hypothetical protein
MAMSVERVSNGSGQGSDLYVLEATTSEDVLNSLTLSSRGFTCLVAWDSRRASVDEVSKVVRYLLDAGAVYVCTWGPGCERVHDICDEAQVGPFGDGEQVAMTTWHPDESLAEALWFVLDVARPEDRWVAECRATVAISIGSHEWASEMRVAFSDPRAFRARCGGDN